MVTIAEVAARAKVSVATVSRVLNNNDNVRPATAQRVRLAIEDLNYTVNQSARNLRRNESRVVLALAPNFSNPFYSSILAGIGDLSRDSGYSVLICNTAGQSEEERRCLEMLVNHRADGAILLGCRRDDLWLAEYAAEFPIVQCCEYVPEIDAPSVSIDNYAAAVEAVRYLQGLGHTRIAMIGSSNRFISTQRRREGFFEAMGVIPTPEDAYEEADEVYSFASGQVAARKLLACDPRPSAIFCISDILALSAISAAQELGISVPEELTVVGFDDVDYTTMFHPFLTTVAQPCYEMGRRSLSLLLGLLQGDAPPVGRRWAPHRLVVRESSGPVGDGIK